MDYHRSRIRLFDGMSAPPAARSSPIGKELDSLADDVTFGVAPATIVFSQLFVMEYPGFLEPLRPWLPYAAFIIAAFSALRLAKFNLDERQTTSFIGVPTPANAVLGFTDCVQSKLARRIFMVGIHHSGSDSHHQLSAGFARCLFSP